MDEAGISEDWNGKDALDYALTEEGQQPAADREDAFQAEDLMIRSLRLLMCRKEALS